MNSQATEPVVRATFRKSVSDGNYGTESAEITLELPTLPGQLLGPSADLLSMARTIVQDELLRSPAPIVRRTLETQLQARAESASSTAATVPPDDDDLPL